MKLYVLAQELSYDNDVEVIELDLLKAYEKWRINHWDKPYTIFKCSVLFERELSSASFLSIKAQFSKGTKSSGT